MQKFELLQLNSRLNVYRFPPNTPIPEIIWSTEFASVTKTGDELSVVVSEDVLLDSEDCSPNWVALSVKGPLPHGMIGVMAELSNCIASAGCSIFTIATFDTDYILVSEEKMDTAKAALIKAGHSINS